MTIYNARSTSDLYNIVKKAYQQFDLSYNFQRIAMQDGRTRTVAEILGEKNARLNFNFVKEYFNKCKYCYHIHESISHMNYFIFQTYPITKKEKAHILRTIRRIAILKRLYMITKNMNIFIIMNPAKRCLPNGGNYINTEHINGGFTFVNRNDIFIIRKEDYDKVLIHEFLHHNARIHYEAWNPSNIQRLKMHFNISMSCDLLPNEAIIEAYACLLNTIFYSIETQSKFKELLRKDQEHSLQLAKKIIKYQNGKAWYELTNCYCYTVIKSIIYLYFDKFLKSYKYDDDTQITDFLISHSSAMYKRIERTPVNKTKWLKQTMF